MKDTILVFWELIVGVAFPLKNSSASEQRHSRNFSERNVKTLASLRRGYKYTHQFHKISSKVVQVKLRKNTNEKNFQFEPVF